MANSSHRLTPASYFIALAIGIGLLAGGIVVLLAGLLLLVAALRTRPRPSGAGAAYGP